MISLFCSICISVYRIYGFYDECKRRYNIKLWKTFTDCFNTLPIGKVKLVFYIYICIFDSTNTCIILTNIVRLLILTECIQISFLIL